MRTRTGPVTGRPASRADRGMVAAPHSLAAQSGLYALRRGGSAVDAAIAANAVLCVAYPHMAGLGGDAFLLVKPPSGAPQSVNASGPAAGAADLDFYARLGHQKAIPDRGGPSALTVPGAVDGWRLAHESHGRLDWAELFDDAIHYARRGVAVSRSLAQWYPHDAPLLREHEPTARLYLKDGRPLREGDLLTNPDLAESLTRIARDGARAGFYEGPLAASLCAGTPDSPLSAEDFADYRAHWEEPVSGGYRDLTLLAQRPNTQGFTALQILQILETFEVETWLDEGADLIHHAAEATKLSFADRDAWLTDPAHHDIPLDRLLDPAYARERATLIDAETSLAMGEVPSGVPGGWSGPRPVPEGDTCYLSAVDDDGLVVSLIESVYHDFGSGIVPDGTGILMQNRGSFFSLDPDHHNRLEPGKRTFHTLAPALALDSHGETFAALGSMGGEGQPQTQAMIAMRLVDFGYDVQQAIEAPRWLMGRTWGDASQDLWLEGRISDRVGRELERRGQPVRFLFDWDDNVGHAQAIRVNPAGYYEGGADPRGDGAAIGY